MRFVKSILNWKKKVIVGACENCGREIEVPISNIIVTSRLPYDLKDVIQCECGEYHNLIVDKDKTQTKHIPHNKPDYAANETIKCPRCRSTQLHAGDKGFSLGKAAAGGVLLGPVGLLGGLIGSKKVMITCLKCGYKWQAGKR